MKSPATLPNTATNLPQNLSAALAQSNDAHFFEESISPSSIRTDLTTSDPNTPASFPLLLKAMKWLLAMMSKGRDVSDFFPHVVKLVGCPNLEIRKMVYMYLVSYADHDETCRELALLSINSFQRGLADGEQWIRALALRVLSSIRVNEIMQIQIMAIQKCARDDSPYVRKCAANALAKLSPRCEGDETQSKILVGVLGRFLVEENSTMVLSSAVIAYSEICPEDLALLHGCYRKLCHLLTDMEEWGQVVCMDVLARYCRKFFSKPDPNGSAEVIDSRRRLKRVIGSSEKTFVSTGGDDEGNMEFLGEKQNTIPSRPVHPGNPRRIKRRVVKKAFYSDEEDESEEEEIYTNPLDGKPVPSLAAAMREASNIPTSFSSKTNNPTVDEDEELDEDHRLLLRCSLPLLKSRNSSVVVSVCSLHYYCGVSSIKIRSSVGKALVRIHRDRREIQYCVLNTIRSLAPQCPSAFTPFLNDFFIKAMDPSFTREIKLDILLSLALDSQSIFAILSELKSYIRHDDKGFVKKSVRAVAKVAELSRFVFQEDIAQSHTIVLNCLYGLVVLTQCKQDEGVLGEVVIGMCSIIRQITGMERGGKVISDPNLIQGTALRRLFFITLCTLQKPKKSDQAVDVEDPSSKEAEILTVPSSAIAAVIDILSEWFHSSTTPLPNCNNIDKPKMQNELIRLLTISYPDLDPSIQLQSIHMAAKYILQIAQTGDRHSQKQSLSLSELLLSQGRLDLNPDVRDVARSTSSLLLLTVGLDDTEGMISYTPLPGENGTNLTILDAKRILLTRKPPSCTLPLRDVTNDERKDGNIFRFGTLSCLVGHKAGGKAYLPLPEWAEKNSSGSLRDPVVEKHDEVVKAVGVFASGEGQRRVMEGDGVANEFYQESSSDSDDSSSDEDSDDSEEDSSEDDSDDSDESDDSEEEETESEEESSSEDEKIIQNDGAQRISVRAEISVNSDEEEEEESSSDEESSDDESEDNSSDNDSEIQELPSSVGNLLNISQPTARAQTKSKAPAYDNTESLVAGLAGLVMAPLVLDDMSNPVESKADLEADTGRWIQFVRPELSGGLDLSARYVRGASKKKQLELLGLGNGASAYCLQLKFHNTRTDKGILRRIRLINRSSGSNAPDRQVVPQEIAGLGNKQHALAFLGIDFGRKRAGDRDGTLCVKYDVKTDRGSNVIDVRLPIGEVLISLKLKEKEFEKCMKNLGGSHQRMETKFVLELKDGFRKSYDIVLNAVSNEANLTPIKTSEGNGETFYFVASLPSSGDVICVQIYCSSKTGRGLIVVACDSTIASNELLKALKGAITV